MIVPMKKVSLIVMGDKKKEALKTLRKLGIIHIEITEGSGEKISELKGQVSLLESAIFSIGKAKKVKFIEADTEEALSAAKELTELGEEKKACQAELAALNAELGRLKDWGDIDPESIEELARKGVDISLYEMPAAEYASLDERVNTVKLAASKSSVKFMLIKTGEEEDAIVSLENFRLELPKRSVADMRRSIAEAESRICAIDEKAASYAVYQLSMKKAVKVIEKQIEFEVYASGMAETGLSEDAAKDVSVAYFTGYIEAENLGKLKQAAAENSWGLLAEDPTEEDNVPTKLKNNKFVSLIYPLTDFLGTVPGYFEHDISGWFLAFILIFFGIIFGDGGYGLFICAIVGLMMIRNVILKKPITSTYLLIGLFGLSTIVWGTLTCTWFGLSPEQIPRWLQSLSIPVISNVNADVLWYPVWTQGKAALTTAQNLQILCFSLALIQLTVAHIKGIIRNIKSLKVLGDIGAILQLVGIYYLVLSFVVNADVFSFGLAIGSTTIGTITIALIGAGFLLSFVFSNYEGSIIKSIVASIVNIVSVLLGVVNIFSDIVSYIRLWAVGLAGAAIATTVNELAGPLFGNFLFMILAIILLVFGHGLNMILNILSVIVHGIRLNTLEFSSHLDMSWSGHKFKPFKEQID